MGQHRANLPGAATRTISVIEALRFVQGAVSKKDFVPALSHFRIADGRICGYNGKLCLSSPIGIDLDCAPKAAPLIRAIAACEDTAQLHMTPGGKLAIRSGKFRAHIDCLAEPFPDVRPEGVAVAVDGALLPTLAALYPFTADDASRPWAAAVLLCGQSAYATNNVIAVESWLGYHFPYVMSVPRFAIREVLRIGEEPIGLQATAESVTFHYSGERWLRTQLHSIEWPDIVGVLDRVLDRTADDWQPIPEGLFDALDIIAPFANEHRHVFLMPGKVATEPDENVGAAVELASVQHHALFNIDYLRSLKSVAERICFSTFPEPCAFVGGSLRGAIIGMRI